MNTRKLLTGYGFVDEATVVYNPLRAGYEIAIQREFEKVMERLDMDGPAGWVLFRRALQGGSSL